MGVGAMVGRRIFVVRLAVDSDGDEEEVDWERDASDDGRASWEEETDADRRAAITASDADWLVGVEEEEEVSWELIRVRDCRLNHRTSSSSSGVRSIELVLLPSVRPLSALESPSRSPEGLCFGPTPLFFAPRDRARGCDGKSQERSRKGRPWSVKRCVAVGVGWEELRNERGAAGAWRGVTGQKTLTSSS